LGRLLLLIADTKSHKSLLIVVSFINYKMPHQCTKCSKVYPDASEELLKGCECGSRFFYYIRQEKFDSMKQDVQKVMEELDRADKDQVEKDIRELTGLTEKPDEPVILDLESVKVLQPGKFEIDIVNLFSKNRPLIYKLGEGKYIIDIASSLDKKNKKRVIDASVLDDVEENEENGDDGVDEQKDGEEKVEEGNNEENEDKSDKEIVKEIIAKDEGEERVD